MEILLAVDKFLSLPVVRWFLLVSTIATMLAAGIYKSRLAISEMQLKAAKGDIASYAAHIELQNVSIAKAGQEYEQAKKKALVAQQKAEELKRQLDKLGGVVIQPSDCETMVKQAIAEVKRGN